MKLKKNKVEHSKTKIKIDYNDLCCMDCVSHPRAPTENDTHQKVDGVDIYQYSLGTIWLNMVVNEIYMLVNIKGAEGALVAIWKMVYPNADPIFEFAQQASSIEFSDG